VPFIDPDTVSPEDTKPGSWKDIKAQTQLAQPQRDERAAGLIREEGGPTPLDRKNIPVLAKKAEEPKAEPARFVDPDAQGPRPKAQGSAPEAQAPRPEAQGPRPEALTKVTDKLHNDIDQGFKPLEGLTQFVVGGVAQFFTAPIIGALKIAYDKVTGSPATAAESYLSGYQMTGDILHLPHNAHADLAQKVVGEALHTAGENAGKDFYNIARKTGMSEKDAWKAQAVGQALPEAVVALLPFMKGGLKVSATKPETTLHEAAADSGVSSADILAKAQEIAHAKDTSPLTEEGSIVESLKRQVNDSNPFPIRKMKKKEGYESLRQDGKDLDEAASSPMAKEVVYGDEHGEFPEGEAFTLEPKEETPTTSYGQGRALERAISHYEEMAKQALARGGEVGERQAAVFSNKAAELKGKREELRRGDPVDPAEFLAELKSKSVEKPKEQVPPPATNPDIPPLYHGVIELNTARPPEELIHLATSALGPLLQQERYTAKTLGRLDPRRISFPVKMIEEQLRRPDVSEAERKLFHNILPLEGEVSAKFLIDGFKLAVGDFKLTPRETPEWADMGLERIDPLKTANNPITRIWEVPQHMDPGAVERVMANGIRSTNQDHFDTTRQLGFTRSFIRDGVEHVVEIQSDLIPSIDKSSPKGQALSDLQKSRDDLLELVHSTKGPEDFPRGLKELKERFPEWVSSGENNFHYLAYRIQSKLDTRILEQELALDTKERIQALDPLLKRWDQRIVRETLARAAEEGDREVRFATTDTMAKGEGWERNSDTGKFIDPGNQSIYDRYGRDVLRYLKQLGGKPTADGEWISVPVPSSSVVEMFTFDPVRAARQLLNSERDLREGLMAILQKRGEEAARQVEQAYRNLQSSSTIDTLEKLQREVQGTWGRDQNAEMENMQLQKAAQAEGLTPEIASKIQDHLDQPHLLEGKARELYDKYYVPTRASVQDSWRRIAKVDPNNPLLVDWHGRIPLRGFWEKFFGGLTNSTLGSSQGLGGKPSTLRARSIFQIPGPDGRPLIISQGKDGSVLAWSNKKATMLSPKEKPLRPGMTFMSLPVEQVPNQRAIESATNLKYVDNPIFIAGVKAAELKKYANLLDTLNRVMESPVWKSMTSKAKNPAEGHRRIKYTERLPVLDKFAADPQLAEVLEDFLKPSPDPRSLVGVLHGLTNFAIKSFMLIPIKHIDNEAVHYITESGLTGMIPNPARLKALSDATTSVLKQDHLQREIAKANGSLLYPKTLLDGWMTKTMDAYITKAKADPDFLSSLKKAGLAPVQFFDGWSQMSNMGMWATRDILYTARILEHLNQGMKLPEAIQQVDKFMPTYKLPSRISLFGVGPKQRWVSEFMQNKALTVFSRYHHGALSALGNSVKGLAEKGHQVESLNHIAGYVFSLAVMYPLLDAIYTKMTGDEEHEIRRAGGLHYLEDAGKIHRGEKRPEAAFMAIITPSPVPYALLQASPGVNTDFYFRRQIRNPEDSPALQATDTAKFIGKQQFNPAGMSPVIEGRQSFSDWWLSQLFDVVKKSDPSKVAKAQQRNKSSSASAYSHRSAAEQSLDKSLDERIEDSTSPAETKRLLRLKDKLQKESLP